MQIRRVSDDCGVACSELFLEAYPRRQRTFEQLERFLDDGLNVH
jgi:hypothetical protein